MLICTVHPWQEKDWICALPGNAHGQMRNCEGKNLACTHQYWYTDSVHPLTVTVALLVWSKGIKCDLQEVGWLVLWAQSTIKDYIRAENKPHSISKLFISQVIIPQDTFFLTYLYSVGTQPGICENLPTASDLFYSAGLHRNHVFATGKLRRRFGKNAGECTGRV